MRRKKEEGGVDESVTQNHWTGFASVAGEHGELVSAQTSVSRKLMYKCSLLTKLYNVTGNLII